MTRIGERGRIFIKNLNFPPLLAAIAGRPTRRRKKRLLLILLCQIHILRFEQGQAKDQAQVSQQFADSLGR